jgi:hypothetical protein
VQNFRISNMNFQVAYITLSINSYLFSCSCCLCLYFIHLLSYSLRLHGREGEGTKTVIHSPIRRSALVIHWRRRSLDLSSYLSLSHSLSLSLSHSRSFALFISICKSKRASCSALSFMRGARSFLPLFNC